MPSTVLDTSWNTMMIATQNLSSSRLQHYHLTNSIAWNQTHHLPPWLAIISIIYVYNSWGFLPIASSSSLSLPQIRSTPKSCWFLFLRISCAHSLLLFPQHTHSGPRYFMPRPLQWDLSSANLSTSSSSSEGPLRPSKFIPLRHQFQEFTPLFRIVITYSTFHKIVES